MTRHLPARHASGNLNLHTTRHYLDAITDV